MSEEQKITIEIHNPPVAYKIDVGKNGVEKALKQLQTFVRNNNKKVLKRQLAYPH